MTAPELDDTSRPTVSTTDPLPEAPLRPLADPVVSPSMPLVLTGCVLALAGGMAAAAIDDPDARAVVFLVSAWLPVGLVLLPLRRRTVPIRPHWKRMLAAVLVLLVAATVEVVARLRGWTVPAEESMSDLVFAAFYVLLGSGIWTLVRRHGRSAARDGLIDGMVMLIPPLILMAEFVLTPAEGGQVVTSSALRLLVAAYPFADVVLLAALVWLVATPTLTRAHLGLLVAGMSVTLLADLLLAVEALTPSEPARRVTEGIYPLAYTLLAAGIARGAITRIGRNRDVQVVHWGRVGVLAFGAILGPLCIVVAAIPPYPLPVTAIAVATLVSAVFIVWRMVQLARILGRTTNALTRARRELKVQATHDPLTGLLNRSALDDVLDSLSDPDKRPAALLSIDLDGFKAVNDTHGHAAGDAVLVAVARRLRHTVRAEDLVVRMGGDEFLAAMPGMHAEEATLAADRLVRAISEPVGHKGAVLRITASVGIVLLGTDTVIVDIDAAVARADAAMYAAKRSGSGRVRASAMDGAGAEHAGEADGTTVGGHGTTPGQRSGPAPHGARAGSGDQEG